MKKIIIAIVFILMLISNTNIWAATEYRNHFSLVVFSGEPEGVIAAVSAARAGADTLLIMEREKPGGLMTYGGLNFLDLNYDLRGKLISGNLFTEWHQQVGAKTTFSSLVATNTFLKMIANEENLQVYSEMKLQDVKVTGKFIKSLQVADQQETRIITAERFIDASQDADLAALAGVPFFIGGADGGVPGRVMPVTQVLKIGNINYKQLKKDVETNKFGFSVIADDNAYGFEKIGQLYEPEQDNAGLRGLNIVLKGRGDYRTAYINALLMYNIDPLSPASLRQARRSGMKEAESVVDFLRQQLGGFSQAELLDFPPELYIRESRHILAQYQLQPEDQFYCKIFPDTIAIASYPLDYQPYNSNNKGFVLFNPAFYGIPLRSLIPINRNNLLVVGRSSGYSSLAAASSRVITAGMFTAEAAGLASALSLDNEIMFDTMVNSKEIINQLQLQLNIEDKIPDQEINILQDEEFEPYFNLLLNWGLIIGGYDNNFRLEEIISERAFANLLIEGLIRRRAPILYEWVPGGLTTLSSGQPLTRNKAAQLLLTAISKQVLKMAEEDYYPLCQKENLIPDLFTNRVESNRELTRKEAYILAGHFLSKYKIPVRLKMYRGEL